MSASIDIEEAVKRIMEHGPNRVVINSEQDAVGSERARREHGVKPDVIFIRNDGWSLGAPERFAAAAYGTWPDCWVAFMQKPDRTAKPISEYRLG